MQISKRRKAERNTMKNINDFSLEGVQLNGDGKKGKKVFENDDQVMDFYKYLQGECEEIFKLFEKAKNFLRLVNLKTPEGEKGKREKMKIKITFEEPLLGTASADPEVHEKFIALKSADKEKTKEELAALSAEELIEDSITVFPRDDDGRPMLWDYQIKGFLKEAIGTQVEFGSVKLKAKGGKEISMSKWTYKRLVDNFIFVFPRRIPLQIPNDNELEICTRPLRASTMKGERVALASSEEAAQGTQIECEVTWDHPSLEEYVKEALDWGKKKGIGQWRNSGKGRFTWEEI